MNGEDRAFNLTNDQLGYKKFELMRIPLFILSHLLLLTSFSIAQRDFSQVEIKVTQVTDRIFMMEGSGGNIAVLIGDDGTVMIDDQFAPLSDKIKVAIAALTEHPVTYVLNTHWHGDHTGGNENFSKDGAIIVAHENVRQRLSSENILKAFDRSVPAAPEAAWPQITFQDDMKIHFNEEDILLMHIHNAHTDGDAFIYFMNQNVLHMGDCFFNSRFPYIDLGSGGSIDGAIEAVEAALMLTDTKTMIIPGHGKLARKSDLLKYYTMLVTMKSRVMDAMADGNTLEEMKAAGLDKGYESWGQAFISGGRFIDIIWSDYNREKE